MLSFSKSVKFTTEDYSLISCLSFHNLNSIWGDAFRIAMITNMASLTRFSVEQILPSSKGKVRVVTNTLSQGPTQCFRVVDNHNCGNERDGFARTTKWSEEILDLVNFKLQNVTVLTLGTCISNALVLWQVLECKHWNAWGKAS